MKLARVLVGLAGLTLVVGALGGAPEASAADGVAETVGGLANTWTNYKNGGGDHGPSIQAYSTISIACKLHGLPVQNGNDWWYRIASQPWDGQYYVSADAFYNNGSTSGSLGGTPWFDPAVSDCGQEAPSPPVPAALPTVHLERGAAYGSGFWYSVSFANFGGSQDISVSCRDSADPDGFYSSGIRTNGSGNGSAAKFCRSEDSGEHWVVAGGVESNHVSWSRGTLQTPVAPKPGDASTKQPAPPPSVRLAPKFCPAVSGGDPIKDGGVASELYYHYLAASGDNAQIDWSYFARNSDFVSKAKALSIGGSVSWRANPVKHPDMFSALGSFCIERLSQRDFYIYDHYDFTPSARSVASTVLSIITIPKWMEQLGGAEEFAVHSSGKL